MDGRIIRVDLTSSKITKEEIPEDTLRKFIGCWGLALKILYDELPMGVQPLEPENPLVVMTGPLTGVPWVPSGNQTSIATLNADTGYTAGRSHTHGFVGLNLRGAGLDGIIVQGASDEPIYLWVHDETVEIRDASSLWGKDTHETEDFVKEDLGNLRASVAAIGPAGENMIGGAGIFNDKNHSFAHSGVGAVAGSKKLKAMAFYGTRKVPLADENTVKKAGKKWKYSLENEYPTNKRRKRAGTIRLEHAHLKQRSLVSAKNMLEVSPPEYMVGVSKNKITPKSCFACSIACAYDIELTFGPYRGIIVTRGPGGEGHEGAASLMGVYEQSSVIYLTDLCDKLGFDSSTVGAKVALAIECFEKGLLTKENTDGLELRWGDAKLVEMLFRRAANKEGWLGKVLSLPPLQCAEMIGGDAPKFLIHIKGSGMNLHDWRAMWGNLFGQIVGGGSGWPASGADYVPEPDLGYAQNQDPLEWKDKPEGARKIGMKKYFEDSVGTCWFSTWGVPGTINHEPEAVSGATGWDFTSEEMLLVGERIMNLERVFNVRRGLSPANDCDVSPRLLEPPPSGLAKGKSIGPHLKGMVMEYYRLMGWDEKTGKPLPSTLKRVGLGDLIEDIW